ncbi:MAG: class I SAM-dependent methyltransferase [Candidatus Lokiarchaeota archaeon]|nr:class I SAM-dependent methyltransferase [Candidatus Lokiarchaeota archaeon]
MAEGNTVKSSWDKIGRRYHASRDVHKIDAELRRIAESLPAGAAVLDAGSGAGVPVAAYLAGAGMKVTGIDVSDTMLELARRNVPGATFLKQDMTRLEFPDGAFDAVVCLYTLWHIPRAEHEGILVAFHRVLKPGGLLVVNTGARGFDGWSSFFGEPMLWSNHEPAETTGMARRAGFSIEQEGNLERGGELQFWLFGRKA